MSSSLRHLLLLRRRGSAAAAAAAVLSPSDPSAVLSAKQKSRAALSLLKSESDPERILSICRSADLHPSSHLDRHSLSLAITNLSKTNSTSSIQTLVSSLLLQRRDAKSLSHAIVLFGQAGMLDSALSAFTSSPPSTKNLNSLLFAAILAKDHPSVERFFRMFPDVEPDVDTYNVVVKSFSESGSTRSAYSLLDEMRKKNIEPNTTTFNTMISGFYRENKLDEVDKVIDLMRRKYNSQPGLSTYNERIMSLCKLKRSKEAKGLFDEMVRKKMKMNPVTYSHLIVGFCKEGDLEEAKRFYGEMKKKGLVAGSSCYFSLIHYLCQGEDFEAALGVCNEMMERNWVPCFATMKLLVKGLAKIGKGEEASEIVGKMKERFPGNAEMWKEVEEGLPK
ncbi:putative pentatricopeptide repeat-containing protein, mitochondrial [Iris pallida]|uniref:Pentatricopeptide repeat-containing protein, mitochondrial n=1 Tax=Iris pallida TaxID=29817 RepID=A0AAX6HPY7_IRIPA|nr:putative pentatricopeptide repeat-containing protein, mitochondrial [Iris pallida]